MSSYSYKVTRETTGPRGGSYSTTSYSSPTAYSPVSRVRRDCRCRVRTEYIRRPVSRLPLRRGDM